MIFGTFKIPAERDVNEKKKIPSISHATAEQLIAESSEKENPHR